MGYTDPDDEFNNKHLSGPVLITIALVSAAILVVLVVVLASNNAFSGRNNLRNSQMLNPKETPTPGETAAEIAAKYTKPDGTKDIEGLYKDKLLRAEDLDFWGMYGDRSEIYVNDNSISISPEGEDGTGNENNDGVEVLVAPGANLSENDDNSSEVQNFPSASASADASPSASPSPQADNNPTTMGAFAAGNETELIKDVPLNNMVITNVRIIDDKMGYYVDGVKTSKLGVDISSDSGLVDFEALKNDGVDFVMIRVGQRGYDSGVITRDSDFERNMKGATNAGLKIGLYFSSRAVTVKEAEDEAVFCLQEADNYAVTYPVAFVFDNTLLTASRTDNLSVEDKTKIAEAFLKEVTQRGFKAAIYGNKDYILNDLDPEKILKEYDVWLNDINGIPEYPYQYNLWKYQGNHTVTGVEKPAAYTMSLIDYSAR